MTSMVFSTKIIEMVFLNDPCNCKYHIDELEPNLRQPADYAVLPNASAAFYGLKNAINILYLNFETQKSRDFRFTVKPLPDRIFPQN